MDSVNRKLVAAATSLEGSKKNNFRSFIHGQSSTIPADFVKIGLMDVEIIGLKEIAKNLYLKRRVAKAVVFLDGL